MPATQAKGGFGTKLYRDDGTGNFTSLGEIMDVSGPSISQVIVDATNMASPNGWSEKIATGVKEAGDVTFQMNFLESDATQTALRQDIENNVQRNFRLVHPSTLKRISFSAFVASMGHSYPMRDKMVRDVTLTITGQPVFENNS